MRREVSAEAAGGIGRWATACAGWGGGGGGGVGREWGGGWGVGVVGNGGWGVRGDLVQLIPIAQFGKPFFPDLNKYTHLPTPLS